MLETTVADQHQSIQSCASGKSPKLKPPQTAQLVVSTHSMRHMGFAGGIHPSWPQRRRSMEALYCEGKLRLEWRLNWQNTERKPCASEPHMIREGLQVLGALLLGR